MVLLLKGARDFAAFIERELTYYPGVNHHYGRRRSGHYVCVLSYAGRTRFVIFPATPSDRRGPYNCIAVVRRQLRELGAERLRALPQKVSAILGR